MKVVYCLPDTYRPGGIARVVSLKANYMADMLDYEVYIITSHQNGYSHYYNFSDKICFIDLNIPHDMIIEKPFLYRFFMRYRLRKNHYRKLNRILIEIKADIVISTFTHETSFLPKINDGSKKVLEFHFCRGYKNMRAKVLGVSFLTKLGYRYRTLFEEKFVIPKYDIFVVLSEEDKANWKNVHSNIFCIPNPLSYETYKYSSLNSRIALAVGRLDLQKGFDKLIPIWKKVEQEFPDWKLHIYGTGMEKERLLHMINDYGLNEVVKIFPATQNIESVFLNGSIYLLTSRYEGFGMTLQEAMTFGVPGIAYNCTSGPSEIITNGEDGFVVKYDDQNQYAEKLIQLLGNEELRRRMGEKAAINMRRYSIDRIMVKWKDIFEKTL